MKLILSILIFINFNTWAQIDTIKFCEGTSTERFKKYFSHQDYRYVICKEDTINFNKEDSIVFGCGNYFYGTYYLQFFDRKNNLILEGIKGESSEKLTSLVKYYFKNGNLKKTEHYQVEAINSSDNLNYRLFDGYVPYGNWKTYRRKGTLRMETNHYLKTCVDSKEKQVNFIREKIRYSRKGRIKSRKKEIWYSL